MKALPPSSKHTHALGHYGACERFVAHCPLFYHERGVVPGREACQSVLYSREVSHPLGRQESGIATREGTYQVAWRARDQLAASRLPCYHVHVVLGKEAYDVPVPRPLDSHEPGVALEEEACRVGWDSPAGFAASHHLYSHERGVVLEEKVCQVAISRGSSGHNRGVALG